jgi:hypothetical protein
MKKQLCVSIQKRDQIAELSAEERKHLEECSTCKSYFLSLSLLREKGKEVLNQAAGEQISKSASWLELADDLQSRTEKKLEADDQDRARFFLRHPTLKIIISTAAIFLMVLSIPFGTWGYRSFREISQTRDFVNDLFQVEDWSVLTIEQEPVDLTDWLLDL